ncbi:MAG: hypothetical protein U1E76_10860 [Planctomycetota bacterium]
MLLVFAQALTGGVSRFGVLCYGADGHVAFEADSSSCCSGTGPQHGQSLRAPCSTSAPHASPANGKHCGPCLDVTFEAITRQAHQIHCAAFAPAPATAFVPAWPPARLVYVSLTHRCGESLRVARTVLRI